jgi:dynein heavy chain
LTGVLQVHARKYDLPIDELSFHFTILPYERDHVSYNEQAKRVDYGKKLEVDEQVKSHPSTISYKIIFFSSYHK